EDLERVAHADAVIGANGNRHQAGLGVGVQDDAFNIFRRRIAIFGNRGPGAKVLQLLLRQLQSLTGLTESLEQADIPLVFAVVVDDGLHLFVLQLLVLLLKISIGGVSLIKLSGQSGGFLLPALQLFIRNRGIIRLALVLGAFGLQQ